eukprot:7383655-Prymnesium_polylepis.2
MGHAGLPSDERDVSIQMYQATLPAACVDPKKGPTESKDEQLVELLREGVKTYQGKLLQLKKSAFDNGMWAEDKDDEAPRDEFKVVDDEDEWLIVTDANELALPLSMPMVESGVVMQSMSDSTGPVKGSANTLAKSNYKMHHNRDRESSVKEIWAAAEGVIAACDGHEAAMRFIKKLKRARVSKEETYEDERCAAELAVLLWSSAERSSERREFCSYLNQCLREDNDFAVKHATVVSDALNKMVVALGDRANKLSEQCNWPSGPEADIGWSTKEDATWRGTALPPEHLGFFSEGTEFRTNMFLATSFDRAVAEGFMNGQYESKPDNGRALWTFEFEKHNCHHVNFIGEQSVVKSEREFLLTPYTALKVKKFERSPNLLEQPHRIILTVAPDNQGPSEDLPLAPWS